MMKVFLKKLSVLGLLFLGLTCILSFASLHVLRGSGFYKSSFLVNQVPEDRFDYIVIGASDALTTLNTKTIDSMLSVEGVNLAMDDTSFPSHYLMLQHFLSEGKQTKYCVLAASYSAFDFEGAPLSNNDYRFLMYGNRAYVSDYYKQFSGKTANILYYSKWLPVLGVSYYNTEIFYPSLISIVNSNKRNRFDDKGNYTYPVINKPSRMIDFKTAEVAFKNAYVQKIKALCDKNNIKLLCYITPSDSKNAIPKSVDFDIINHSNAVNDHKYFYDETHVNSIGREICSIAFAKNIVQQGIDLKNR